MNAKRTPERSGSAVARNLNQCAQPQALSGFILAGGKSARMGRDKALLDWHGRTLLDHMTELISNVTDEVHVIGRARFPDRLPGLGPLSGIATALETSATDANLVV